MRARGREPRRGGGQEWSASRLLVSFFDQGLVSTMREKGDLETGWCHKWFNFFLLLAARRLVRGCGMWHSSISDRRVAPSVHGPIWRRCCCASSSRKFFPLVVYVDCFGQSKQNTRASPEGCSRPWLRTAVARGSQSVRGHPHGPDGRWMTGWFRPVGGGCGGYDSGCCDTESPFVGNVMARGCQHTVSGAEVQKRRPGLQALQHSCMRALSVPALEPARARARLLAHSQCHVMVEGVGARLVANRAV